MLHDLKQNTELRRNPTMANIQKYKRSEVGHLCAHYERSASNYSNTDIDLTRTADNYNLAPDHGMSQTAYIKQALNNIHHANRKDLVVMATWIINVPTTLAPEFHKKFLQEAYNFLINRYGTKSGLGENVCISAYVHTDESTQNAHMHFAFLPVITDPVYGKKFGAKYCVNRNDITTFHQDLNTWLNNHGVYADVLNGKTQRDSTGRALSVKEMKYRDRNYQHEYSAKRW